MPPKKGKKKTQPKEETNLTKEAEVALIEKNAGNPELAFDDKPLSMQKPKVKPATEPEPELDPVKEEIVKEELEKAKNIIRPTHFECGGLVANTATSEGDGRWWECLKCRSFFFVASMKKTGEIGNPDDAKVKYQIDKRRKNRTRRLT